MIMKRKMNGLYMAAFILMLVSTALFITAAIVAYALNQKYFSAVFSCSGAFLAFLGIIFAACSKPKRRKRHLENDSDIVKNQINDENTEISVDTSKDF